MIIIKALNKTEIWFERDHAEIQHVSNLISHSVSVLQSSHGLFLIINIVFKPFKQPVLWKTSQKTIVSLQPPVGHTHYLHFSHTIFTTQHTPNTHTCIPFYNLPSCVCPWTLIIDAHNIFSCIPIDPLIETSLICSLLLDIFSSPVSFFSKLWQAVQILAVCCSPLILRQIFLLHKYTRISEKMQSDIRWPQTHSSLWYTVFKIVKKKNISLLIYNGLWTMCPDTEK